MTTPAPANVKSSAATFADGVVGLRDKLRGFILRRVADDATADDLTQETLLRVFRSRAQLRDDTRLEAWLFQSARNVITDHFRRGRPHEELPADLVPEVPTTGDQLYAALARSVRSLIDELPPLYRAPVLLSEIEGRSHAEVAHRLGLTLTAAKTRVRRGRDLLKRKIQECCRLEFNHAGQLVGCESRQPGCCA